MLPILHRTVPHQAEVKIAVTINKLAKTLLVTFEPLPNGRGSEKPTISVR